MPNKITHPMSLRIDMNDNKMFQQLYPYCLSQFVRKAVKLAIADKKFFDKVFFCTKD